MSLDVLRGFRKQLDIWIFVWSQARHKKTTLVRLLKKSKGFKRAPNEITIYACCPFPAQGFFPLPDPLLHSDVSLGRLLRPKADKCCNVVVFVHERDEGKSGESHSKHHCKPEFTLGKTMFGPKASEREKEKML